MVEEKSMEPIMNEFSIEKVIANNTNGVTVKVVINANEPVDVIQERVKEMYAMLIADEDIEDDEPQVYG